MSSFHFDPSSYSPVVAGLVALPRLAPLGPGSPVKAVELGLRRFDIWNDIGERVADKGAALACHAGLWLYYDFLDESHGISQELENPDGNFWHAIMHRREPDAANSKYWWRRVGPHPVLDLIREQAPAIGYTFTSPEAFVDFCQQVRGSASKEEELARRVQLLEWQLLFDWCYRKASGE